MKIIQNFEMKILKNGNNPKFRNDDLENIRKLKNENIDKKMKILIKNENLGKQVKISKKSFFSQTKIQTKIMRQIL